jgi:hypothetical protein
VASVSRIPRILVVFFFIEKIVSPAAKHMLNRGVDLHNTLKPLKMGRVDQKNNHTAKRPLCLCSFSGVFCFDDGWNRLSRCPQDAEH